MVSRRALVLAAVLATVLALAAGAASVQNLDEVEETPGEDRGGGEGVGSPNDTIPPFITIPSWVLLVLFAVSVVTALVGLLLMPDERRKFLRRMALVVVIGVIVLVVADVVELSFTEFEFESTSPNATETNDPGGEASEETGNGGNTTNPTTPFVALFVLLGVGVLGLLLFFRVSTSEADTEADRARDDATARAAVGRAAGRAADRLDDDSLENAVYQAWHEMTTALDVPNPSTRTPAEFERAAIDAGLASDDVETLTDLFREVRYGDATVTAERESRAQETLRHIETAYAGTEADTSGSMTTGVDGDDSGRTGGTSGNETEDGGGEQS